MVDQMAPILGQNLIVDNKPGAGGILDGGPGPILKGWLHDWDDFSNHVINPYIIKSVQFDSIKDITPISIVATTPSYWSFIQASQHIPLRSTLP